MKNKIIDCITFFDENFIFDLRYNILNEYVDKFVICESQFDHKGRKKKLNFKPKNEIMCKKIHYLILEEPFPKKNNAWQNQALQRDYILKNINFVSDEDYIFFSDPDEIPNPEILKNFSLKKKYGIMMQKFFNFKINLFNQYESPWEGTRVAKKKDLKSIDYMRQKIKKKNLIFNFFKIDKQKRIEIFEDAGWHFNNIMDPGKISMKLKSFAHEEFSTNQYSSVEVIKKKIDNKTDLFGRGHLYKKIEIDKSFPKYIRDNLKEFKKFII